MNLMPEFRKYLFNIVIVIIYLAVIITIFLIDSISRHKTFEKNGTKWKVGLRSGRWVNIQFKGSFNLYFLKKISRFKLYILGSDIEGRVYVIHI